MKYLIDFLAYQLFKNPQSVVVYLFLVQKPELLSLPCLPTSLPRLLEEREMETKDSKLHTASIGMRFVSLSYYAKNVNERHVHISL